MSTVATAIEIVSPPREEHYEPIWKLCQLFEHEMMDRHSPKTLEAMIDRDFSSRNSGGLSYIILKEGRVAGSVWFDSTGDGQCLGHLVFAPDMLSPADKLSATRETLAKVFDSGFRKVVWAFFSDNRMFRIFLRKLGAEYEGTFRKHCYRDDELVDADFMASFAEHIR